MWNTKAKESMKPSWCGRVWRGKESLEAGAENYMNTILISCNVLFNIYLAFAFT